VREGSLGIRTSVTVRDLDPTCAELTIHLISENPPVKLVCWRASQQDAMNSQMRGSVCAESGIWSRAGKLDAMPNVVHLAGSLNTVTGSLTT